MSKMNRVKLLSSIGISAMMFTIVACESQGGVRVASLGSVSPGSGSGSPVAGPQEPAGQSGPQGETGPQGQTGPQGPAGANGADGLDGADGMDGADGQSFGLGDGAPLAVGGIVGPNGLGGLGLLANTGDPYGDIPIFTDVLVRSGEVVNIVGDRGFQLASLVDGTVPGSTKIAGSVVGIVKASGDTLVNTGNGAFLIDGLLAAPGEVINISIANAIPIGSADRDALVGVSLFSQNQQVGELLTAGVGSGGQLVTLSAEGELATLLDPVTAPLETATGELSKDVPTTQTLGEALVGAIDSVSNGEGTVMPVLEAASIVVPVTNSLSETAETATQVGYNLSNGDDPSTSAVVDPIETVAEMGLSNPVPTTPVTDVVMDLTDQGSLLSTPELGNVPLGDVMDVAPLLGDLGDTGNVVEDTSAVLGGLLDANEQDGGGEEQSPAPNVLGGLFGKK